MPSEIVENFDELWTKIESTLSSAGEKLSLAETVKRQRITRDALTKYTGKTWGGVPEVLVDVDEPEDDSNEPMTLSIPEPKKDPYWYDDPQDAMVLDHYILARRALGAAMHGALLITGPAGVGKTMSVAQSVKRLADPAIRLFKMDCATVTDPAKWFGRREADATGTHFIKSDFVEAAERGDVILLDEIKRLHPHIHNPIMALLDGSEAVTLSDLNVTIRRHPQTVFIATANEGNQYGGNHRMDWSMRERFSTTLERSFPPQHEEVLILTSATDCDEDAADSLVAIADRTRTLHANGEIRSAISTRTLVAAATWVGFGMDEWGALNITAVPEFDGDASGMVGAESDRQKVLAILAGRLGRGPR